MIPTYPPNNAWVSLPSTLEHITLPELHIFHDCTRLVEVSSEDELENSIDLMLAFPFVVHESKVQRLKVNNQTKRNFSLNVLGKQPDSLRKIFDISSLTKGW